MHKGLSVAVVLAAIAVYGCAERKAPRAQEPEKKFWHDCQETVPAVADGFQHFVCTDVNNRQWEVLVRKQPKK